MLPGLLSTGEIPIVTATGIAVEGPWLFAVIDGMGEHAGGVRAGLVAEVLAAQDPLSAEPSSINDLLQSANARLCSGGDPHGPRGLSAAIAGVAIAGERVTVFSVGDARVHRLDVRGRVLLTVDGRASTESGLLNEGAGGADGLGATAPHVRKIDIGSGVRFLICSEGLGNGLRFSALEDALGRPSPADALDELVALASAAGVQDGFSAIVLDVRPGAEVETRHELARDSSRREVPLPTSRSYADALAADEDAQLSLEARRSARQLYRYAQRVLVTVDAFDLCHEFAEGIRGNLYWARMMKCNLERITHGWLGAYERDGESFRLAPTSREAESDSALRSLAYCYRYLRALLSDETGRDYVRENVPNACWLRLQLGDPFLPSEIDTMLSVLGEVEIDEASLFVDDLRHDAQGRDIHELWLELLTTAAWGDIDLESDDPSRLTRSDRGRLASDLLKLCMILQHLSPELTIHSLHDSSRSAIDSVIWSGLLESGVSIDEVDYEQVEKLVDDLLWRRPPRYLKAEPLTWPLPASYFTGQKGQTPWNDDSPEHDPWAEFH